jgi:hypothetical protein
MKGAIRFRYGGRRGVGVDGVSSRKRLVSLPGAAHGPTYGLQLFLPRGGAPRLHSFTLFCHRLAVCDPTSPGDETRRAAAAVRTFHASAHPAPALTATSHTGKMVILL